MAHDKPKSERISTEEVESIAKKLQEFAQRLPPRERALVNLLLARTDKPTALDATEFVPHAPIAALVARALGPLVASQAQVGVRGNNPWIQSGAAALGWVEGGDPWIKSGGRGAFEQEVQVQTRATDLGRYFNPDIP